MNFKHIIFFLLIIFFINNELYSININKAEMKDLDKLKELKLIDKIHILKYRKKHGKFNSVKDILVYKLIDKDTFDKIENKISVLSTKPIKPILKKNNIVRSSNKKININTASISQFEILTELSFITKVRILKHRSKYGSFSSINDLVKKGLVKKEIFNKIKDKIKVINNRSKHEFSFSKLSFDYDKNMKIIDDNIDSSKKHKEKEEFKVIIQMMKINNYSYSIDKIKKFIKAHKDSEFLDDCYYLLGSCYESKGEYEKAIKEYKTISNNLFSSELRDISILRIAICFENIKKLNESLQYYEKFSNISPDSEYLKLVKNRILEFKR